jgi:hypothetical protein
MKKHFIITVFIITVFVPLLLFAESVTVITKENAVREYCKFFAPVKAKVKYNDKLDMLSQQGDWFKVRFMKAEGCIHKTAVESKTASLTSIPLSGSSGSVSENEAALAGKGFTPQVEASYRAKHPEMKYYLVDKVEAINVSDKDLALFINNGGLKQP